MHVHSFFRLMRFVILPFALVACDTPASPEIDPFNPRDDQTTAAEGDLTFIRFAPDAPPLADTLVSFWAVHGQDRSVQIRYLPSTSYGDGGVCLEFRVPADALLRDADGQDFQPGDSVQITVRVVNTAYFKFEFEPAGLQFDPESPAELRTYYDYRDRDHNGDGMIDEQDEQIDSGFGFWRQERVGEPWTRQTTERDESSERARTPIDSFTRYALASG